MTSVNVQFIKRSSNAKTGNIPVTNSDRNTCPPTCPLIRNGCYAHAGYWTRLNWEKVTSGERGGNWDDLCASVESLKPGTLWRHNVSGDLPMTSPDSGKISEKHLYALIDANEGKRGFTYTHHDMSSARNRLAIETANYHGFTVNLSGNNPADADRLHSLGIGPVVSIVPIDQTENFTSPAGNKIVICPAAIREDIDCKQCKMCAIPDRKTIIGFPAHGSQKSKIEV